MGVNEHLSLQSHDDIILKRMKRRHCTKDAEKLINRLKEIRPNILFGADLIAGFPTENELAFRKYFEFYREVKPYFSSCISIFIKARNSCCQNASIAIKRNKNRNYQI